MSKRVDRPIRADMRLKGFKAVRAAKWEVDGPAMGAIEGVRETAIAAPVPLESEGAVSVFPPHSMTALEFEKE